MMVDWTRMMATRFLLLLLAQGSSDGWREEEVGEGVVWKFKHFDDLYGAKQSVGVLDADPATAKVAFAAAEKGLEKTGAIAERTKAVAAVNGGYFTKEGRPQGILKIEGKTIGTATAGRGAVGIDEKGSFHFQRLRAGDDWPDVRHAMGGVPLLVEGGKVPDFERLEKAAHLVARHPRTAIGTTARGHALLVVVDGRTPEAAGMSCAELAGFLIGLGCSWALNLDGGGSSTLWIRGKPEEGIVSFPCDNRKYDHAGERAVANAILVLAKDVTVVDDPEATLSGEWKRTTEAKGFFGEGYAVAASAGATARWTPRLKSEGEYEIFARWPADPAAGRARFRVKTGEDLREVEVDQSKDAGTWVSLGRTRISKGGSHEVELAGRVADALRWVQRD